MISVTGSPAAAWVQAARGRGSASCGGGCPSPRHNPYRSLIDRDGAWPQAAGTEELGRRRSIRGKNRPHALCARTQWRIQLWADRALLPPLTKI